MDKKWKIYVLHNSHTDIGYTERQERIELMHADFIRQATSILEEIYNGKKDECRTFKWNCESFWCVEKFLEIATKKELEIFEKAVKKGDICLSASYLNLNELVDYDVLNNKIKSAVDYGKKFNVKVRSAMNADINGYSWGYAEALANNGVENLITCIHPHHGMFPLMKKQIPFWWETPSGKKIFVWNSDHYNIGNEFGIAEGYEMTYTLLDEFPYKANVDNRFNRSRERIFRYVNALNESGYPYNFVPIFVSGMDTDNSPPNPKICDFVNKWNNQFGDEIELELSTIDIFLEEAKKSIGELPTYKGDWADWWADGVGSTPAAVKSYKDAQRKYHLCKLLDSNGKLGSDKLLKDTEDNLMLYSEHTWGYSSSISEPCNTLVNELDLRKTALATKANEAISRNLDIIQYNMGDCLLYPKDTFIYKVINPYNEKIVDIAKIYVASCENFFDNLIITDNYGNRYKYQIEIVSRGIEISIVVDLQPKEELIITILENKDVVKTASTRPNAYIGSEGVRDIIVDENINNVTNNFFIDNKFFNIKYSLENGIYSWLDKRANKDLINEHETHKPFTPIYQKTNINTDLYTERKIMGRNRKGFHAETYVAKVSDIKVITDGEIFSKVELLYELEGTSFSSIVLTAYKDIPRVEVVYKVIKDNTIIPENLYIPITFNNRDDSELWVEKTGSVFRPGIDQIPATCMEYYLLQNGLAYVNDKCSMSISLKDAPLIFTGGLDYHMIKLCENKDQDNKRPVYSWVMNNFWETNFKANLGGSYEFTYIIEVSEENDINKLMSNCYKNSTGLIVFPIKLNNQ